MAVIVNCAHCGCPLTPGDRFCAQCGADLLSCAHCGESLLPGDLSCPECGTPVEPGESSQLLPYLPGDSPAITNDLIERLRRATLGEFEIGPELGRGGMAAVFLAHDIALDRKVAIKVMSPGLLGEGMTDRFKNEAVTIANLHHPNIVSLYSVRQSEGLHFFVMRYVRGRSLEQVIQQTGRLPLPIVRSILYQVGSALAYAHRSRVIHRDIKPANILIDGDGDAIVTDFGIAKAAASPTLTLTGALVGTPAYMSPEQCSGIGLSWASDQYALGAVAYEMLTGVPPFSGSTLTVMQAHVDRTPRPIREQFPDCPPELEAAVFQMLAKNPADRWPRMSEAMAALGAAPLADDDPFRVELIRLATDSGSAVERGESTPTSPAPENRPVPAVEEISGAPVGAISILPPPAGLEVGDSFVLVAMVRGAHGTRLPPTQVTWSSEGSAVLRFEGAGGVAVAVAAGSTLLTAHCRGVRAQLPVEVAHPRADEIVISPLGHPVGVGDEIRLEATTHDKRGRPVARSVTWQSDDASTATITADGALVALTPGFARITAVLDDARANIVIPVLPARVAAIQLADWPTNVAEGRSFVVTATPVDHWENPLAGRTVTWNSSDVRVAMVSAGGRVTARGPGSAVLTATCENISASIRVSVGSPAAAAPAPAIVTSDPRPTRRGRRRSRRAIILGAAVGASLTGGVIWLLERAPIPSGSFTTQSPLSTAVSEPPGYSESNFQSDTVAPGPASAVEAHKPVRRPRKQPNASVSPSPSGPPAADPSTRPSDPGQVERVQPTAELVDVKTPPLTMAPPSDEATKPAPPSSAATREEVDRKRVEALLRSGANECYAAVRAKNLTRLSQMYHPATAADEDNLKKLSRVLRTPEWSAAVGDRVEGHREIGPASAAIQFSFRLTWKDAFGGHLASQPVFRAELARRGAQWQLSSCRIVGSPKL